MTHRSGFVNIIGMPNVGKSTLMNQLVGEKLSIITPKAQTTRHRILGIVNGDDYQIIYSDTPGYLEPKYGLHRGMMQFVDAAIEDADVFLYLLDACNPVENEELSAKIKNKITKLIIVLNKIDLVSQDQAKELIVKFQLIYPKAWVIPVSALANFNLALLSNTILSVLPENPPFFDKDQLTDKPERFFTAEMIREKIFKYYQQEIPYSTEVLVIEFKDEDILRIEAEIYVERQSQKGILIGKAGESLKRLGTQARLDLEAFFEKKVYLKLFVKVRENWRNDQLQLSRFGYNSNKK